MEAQDLTISSLIDHSVYPPKMRMNKEELLTFILTKASCPPEIFAEKWIIDDVRITPRPQEVSSQETGVVYIFIINQAATVFGVGAMLFNKGKAYFVPVAKTQEEYDKFKDGLIPCGW